MRRIFRCWTLVLFVSMLGVGTVAQAATPAAAPDAAPSGNESQPYDPAEDPQIVGGSPTTTTTYPWMAAILLSDDTDPFLAQFCGGTLIDPRYVLTAAHCITNFDPDLVASDLEVVLGKSNLDTVTTGDRRSVASITLHPSWVLATRQFDFALLELSAPALGIPTAAYATDTTSAALNASAVILGWGANDGGATVYSPNLHLGVIKVLAPPTGTGSTTCGTYTGAEFFPASHICGGVSQNGGTPDNCIFDDGGPMVVGNPGGWRLIGVTTDIGPCGSGDPSLYARVSAGAAWIDTVLNLTPTDVGTYHAITPLRILDTRNTTGLLGAGYVAGQWTINPQVTGFGGVPFDGSAVAVVVNVTATQPNKAGNLTVFPTGSPLPLASNLNFVAGQTVPNLVTVKLGQVGKISIGNNVASPVAGSVHIIVDLMGWFDEAEAGALFHAMAPNRIVDTRFGTVANPSLNTTVPNNSTGITPKVCGTNTGVDAAASAVVINATVKSGSTIGHLTLWPTGSAPNVSNLNFTAAHTIANLAIVKVGPSCTIKVANSPGATFRAPINVILDVVGWFGPDNTPDGGGHFHAMSPRRTVDTRFGTVDNARNTTLTPQETYDPFARNLGPISANATAIIFNLTATQPTKTGHLTLFPNNPLPLASNLNFVAGKTVPNLAIVQVHSDDKVRVNNSGGNAAAGFTHVILDAMGWFEP